MGAESTPGLTGGLQTSQERLRRWRWESEALRFSAPVRCKREQWYLARAEPANGAAPTSCPVTLRFCDDADEPILTQRVDLAPIAGAGGGLVGWVQAPPRAARLQIGAPPAGVSALRQVTLHPIAERDPKCHPLANVPRWSTYRPPFPIERALLPASLAGLAGALDGLEVELLSRPRSLRHIAARAIGAACVIDPAWILQLGWTLHDVERVAAGAWIIVDLDTMARLACAAGVADTSVATWRSAHEIMSARVEYADMHTRGFALFDVLPYGVVCGRTEFAARVLRATRSWKRYGTRVGFAPILTAQTPWEDRCGDVLSASRAIEQGELVATDLPWLVAGTQGTLLAPTLARRLLRAHLGLPTADPLQFWNRWDEVDVVLRDIADLARRYEPLRTARWLSSTPGFARLGLSAGPPRAARRLMVSTGRVDLESAHDGVPAEPMMIFMKWLAREMREGTPWARAQLADTSVTWQFDTSQGLRRAPLFDAADDSAATRVLALGLDDGEPANGQTLRRLAPPHGVLGDGCFEFQEALTEALTRWIVGA